MPKVEEKTAPAVEVVVEQETALAAQHGRGLPEAPSVGGLAWSSDPAAVVANIGKALEGLQRAAIALTFPGDWIAGKDRDDNVLCTLNAAGCARVEGLLGLSIRPVPPAIDLTPEAIDLPGGHRGERTRGLASSKTLRQEDVEVEVTRGDGEQFTGRQVDDRGMVTTKRGDAVGGYPPDLRTSARTALRSKATRNFLGLKNLPPSRLDEVWRAAGYGDTRKASMIGKGAGFGTGTDRAAAGVAEGDVKAEAKKLGDEILRRTGGDTEAARSLLKELTQNKEGKYAKESVAQFTKADQVAWAWERLRKHSTFGDGAQQQPTGGEREREPGE